MPSDPLDHMRLTIAQLQSIHNFVKYVKSEQYISLWEKITYNVHLIINILRNKIKNENISIKLLLVPHHTLQYRNSSRKTCTTAAETFMITVILK